MFCIRVSKSFSEFVVLFLFAIIYKKRMERSYNKSDSILTLGVKILSYAIKETLLLLMFSKVVLRLCKQEFRVQTAMLKYVNFYL